LVAYAGWRGWALDAWKIPTDRADAILPKLRTVAARFGTPCAVMRDLGRAVIEAARDFVAGLDPPIPVLGCHLHFLRDIGTDLLRAAHDDLRTLFRRFKVQSRLRALARDLGRALGTDIDGARRALVDWLAGGDEHFRLPGGNAGLAVVRALGQWVPTQPTAPGFCPLAFAPPLQPKQRATAAKSSPPLCPRRTGSSYEWLLCRTVCWLRPGAVPPGAWPASAGPRQPSFDAVGGDGEPGHGGRHDGALRGSPGA
jgi:hypothetical protein